MQRVENMMFVIKEIIEAFYIIMNLRQQHAKQLHRSNQILVHKKTDCTGSLHTDTNAYNELQFVAIKFITITQS